ncbi:MAG: hypothetical protein RL277_330 [Planctomycetota bacterium]|jgi:hypothetical protein
MLSPERFFRCVLLLLCLFPSLAGLGRADELISAPTAVRIPDEERPKRHQGPIELTPVGQPPGP